MRGDTERKHHPDTDRYVAWLRARLDRERITLAMKGQRDPYAPEGRQVTASRLAHDSAFRQAFFFDSLHNWPEVGRHG